MKKIMRPYNTMEDLNLQDSIGFKPSAYIPSYVYNGNSHQLDAKDDEDAECRFKVKDNELKWNMSINGLNLERKVSIAHPEKLFGACGVASCAASLGMGAICISSASDRLEAFKICTFEFDTRPLDIKYTLNLSKGKYRGNITIKTVLYLAEDPSGDERYPKQKGTILGELDHYVVDLFDDQTLFPVYEVTSDDPAPWWVACNWNDIEDDPFISEYVAIVINKSNPMYEQLCVKNEEKFNPLMLAEVMSAAMQTIISKIRESDTQWQRIMSNVTFAEGTIAYMVQYMRTTLEWDFSSPECIAKSIREYVYSRMAIT